MRIAFRSLGVFCILMAFGMRAALSFETEATAAIAVDHATGLTLMEKNADLKIPPASMSKLMTLNMVFEALREGRLTLDMKLPVSAKAVSYGGSSMFLRERERVTVEDLIRGIVVMSGNDACVVVAEALSPDGTEAGFARLMTERGRQIGLTNSVFTNSNGWPDSAHRMTARDLVVLARRLIDQFPEYYTYFAEEEYGFDERVPDNRFNRNPLLGIGIGGDGLKTGYTREAGYGMVGSAVRDGRRVIFVISGLANRRLRTGEAERLINWYFLQFTSKTLFRAGEPVAEVPVWLGTTDRVDATVLSDASVLVPAPAGGGITARAELPGYAEAPFEQGSVVGELIVEVDGFDQEFRFPLVSSNAVAHGGFWARLKTAIQIVLDRILRPATADVL